MVNKEAMRTIKETNNLAKNHPDELPAFLRSYTTVRGLIVSGSVPAFKLGNRYLLRISDIENFLAGNITPTVAGIRKID